MFTAAAVDHLVGVHVGGSNGDDGTDVSSLSGNETTTSTASTTSEDDTETISTKSLSQGCKGQKKPNATYPERLAMLHFVLQNTDEEGVPRRGVWKEAAQKYKKSYKTVKRIWKRHLETAGDNGIGSDVSSRKKGKCGKKKRPAEEFILSLKDVPTQKRTSLRALAEATGIAKSTLFDAVRDGTIELKNSRMRPTLTDDNKLARVAFVLDNIDSDGRFNAFDSHIHIDEKWFYMTKEKQSYYGPKEEEVETRSCKSKRFITKIMFLTAVARPRYIEADKQWFDGRIGIWPFVYQKPAARNSKNRRKGTLETKPIESIDATVYSNFMLKKVLPAIKQRWPQSEKRKPIIIQEDNCKVHKVADEFVQAATKERLHVEFHPQPPNSPDFNVLDLGFFNSIQSLKQREQTKTIDELVAAVEKAYWNQDYHKLDDVFLSLQGAFLESLKMEGCNKYKMAHMKKQMKRRADTLERQLNVDPILIAKGRELLDRTNFHQRMEEKQKKKRRKVKKDTSDPLIPSQPSEIL